MNDDIDHMGDLFDDEEPELPEDEAERVGSPYSSWLDPDYGHEQDTDPDDPEFSIEIDPRFEEALDDLFGAGAVSPYDFFEAPPGGSAWDDVRGQHFASQLGALNYMIEGGMLGIAKIFYNEEDDTYQVWVDYDTYH